MSRDHVQDLVVCYDIRDPRRLRRIHRCMRSWGLPLQYSVFYCRLNRAARRQMENQLRTLIDDQDDVRVYGIHATRKTQLIGSRPQDKNIGMFGLGLFDT